VKYLLDTNVISELRRPALVNAGVSKWIADVSLDEVRISVITLHELEHGTRKAERNQPDLGLSLRSWMTRVVLPNYLASALPVTAAIAWRAADYPRSTQDQLPDQLIAATAAEHGLTLITRNVRHMALPGVPLLNPFT